MSLIKLPQKAVLTIAGSDPSGGAGIQADLKTFTMIGVYSGAVISCLTAQNTKGIKAVQTLDPLFVRKQIESVLEDLDVSHIKIGMIGSAQVAESICAGLAGFQGEIICDPIQLSSSGQQLIDDKGYDVVKEKLLAICSVVTPNLPELFLLTGIDPGSNSSSITEAAEKLLHTYDNLQGVIVTGGHSEATADSVTDYLFTRTNAHKTAACLEISHPRVASSNTHGTGCTFSAAFTAYHLLTGSYSKAFQKTTRYMNVLIKKSVPFTIGHGTGPLMHHLK